MRYLTKLSAMVAILALSAVATAVAASPKAMKAPVRTTPRILEKPAPFAAQKNLQGGGAVVPPEAKVQFQKKPSGGGKTIYKPRKCLKWEKEWRCTKFENVRHPNGAVIRQCTDGKKMWVCKKYAPRKAQAD